MVCWKSSLQLGPKKKKNQLRKFSGKEIKNSQEKIQMPQYFPTLSNGNMDAVFNFCISKSPGWSPYASMVEVKGRMAPYCTHLPHAGYRAEQHLLLFC